MVMLWEFLNSCDSKHVMCDFFVCNFLIVRIQCIDKFLHWTDRSNIINSIFILSVNGKFWYWIIVNKEQCTLQSMDNFEHFVSWNRSFNVIFIRNIPWAIAKGVTITSLCSNTELDLENETTIYFVQIYDSMRFIFRKHHSLTHTSLTGESNHEMNGKH